MWDLGHTEEEHGYSGHLMRDYIYMLISITPKYSASQVIGYIGEECDANRPGI
jgi:hypothetical protein